MLSQVACNPPLGQPTTVQPETDAEGGTTQYSLAFNALLITAKVSEQVSYEVQVWHNLFSEGNRDEWRALPLEERPLNESDASGAFFSPSGAQQQQVRWYYGVLRGQPSKWHDHARSDARFTLRLRHNNSREQEAWKWVSEHGGAQDGVLLYQPPGLHIPERELNNYLNVPNDKALTVIPRLSETPYTLLWLITGTDVPSASQRPGRRSFWLGSILNQERWFAITRQSKAWVAPRHGKQELADGQSILYAFLRKDGLHVVVLAVSGIQADGSVQSVLCKDASRQALELVVRNDEDASGKARAVVSVGRTFESAIAAAMYEARKLVKAFTPPSPENDRSGLKWYEDWLDGLGFCTWNSMGFDVTENRLLESLDYLHSAGIQVSNLIIDDGWQTVDRSSRSNFRQGWKSFDAESTKFPNGLAFAVSKARQQHPSLKHVAVWHALLGYWAGVSADGEIARRFATREVIVEDGALITDGKMLVVDQLDASRLYEEFYTFLESSGVDAVKTDVQYAPDEFEQARDRRDLAVTYQRTWRNAYLMHFAGRAVSCMSQTPLSLFGVLAFDYGLELPLRNSDDYFPDVDDAGQTWHVFCNAHNATFTRFLNVVPDWDMFQTEHPWGAWHAAARCLSAGPIWMTDKPFTHNARILKAITAPTARGNSVVLRPSVFGRAANTYQGFHEDVLWKILAYNGSASPAGSSVMGVFNGKAWSMIEVIELGEFMGTETYVQYIVRSFRTSQISRALKSDQCFGVGVSGHEWDILTAHPVRTLDMESGRVQVASLGLLHQMTGNVALVAQSVDIRPSESSQIARRIHVTNVLKALGIAAVWICSPNVPMDVEQIFVLLEDKVIQPQHVTLKLIRTEDAASGTCLIEIDIEQAWVDFGTVITYKNEVKLELFVPI